MAESDVIELEKLAFVLKVFKSMDPLPKADYKAVAAEGGIKNAENVRKKFRRIIQEAGFDLDGDQLVSTDGAANAAEAAVAVTPASKKRKSTGKQAAKGGATDGETPSKKAKHSQSVATGKNGEDEVVEEGA